METSVKEMLKYYCELEIEKFNSSSIFSMLNELVKSQELNLKIEFGKAKDENDKNLYLSLSIYNKNGQLVEIFDEGFLTTYTTLVLIDKKDRCKFLSWQDDEFIEDLNWIIKQLNILAKNK
ncbi:MAG: hypothetical protein SO176_00900 [Bacilli bacterium]|nr:hypothetical protein [Bacilli bacterium]